METKKYTRLDIVEAEPMTYGEYLLNRRWIDLEHEFPFDAEGYCVIRKEDESEEWIPKEFFEEQFIETDDYISRMKFEKNELFNRLNALKNYLKDHDLDVLLYEQKEAMNKYLQVLTERIKQAENK